MAKLLKKAVGLLVAAACVAQVQAAPLTVSSEKVSILVNEAVTKDGTVSATARTGPLTTSGSVFSIDRMGTPSVASPIAAPSLKFAGSFASPSGLPTQATVSDMANAQLAALYPQLKAGLSGYMRQYGITSGWFNFVQRVDLDVGGGVETWTIYWDFFTDVNGRGAFSDAKLVPADPKTLYLVYTPLKVSNDLPVNWAYPGGGTLKYQLRDLQFQPISDWVSVDVGGAYDTVQTDTEVLNSGLLCLMDTSSPGCNPSTADVKHLMDRTGAVMAVVDYMRRVEPVYENQPDGTQTPKMTATVTTRELNYSGCTAPTFHNVGNLSYTLSTTVDRYLAGLGGNPRTVQYNQLQSFNGTSLSPGYDFDMSMQVARSDTGALATKAIDPILKNQLIALADIPGLQYPISPIVINGDPSPTIGSTSGMQWQYGGRDDAYQMTWQLKCAQNDDGYEIATSISATHHYDGWHPNTPALSPVSSTSWSPVALNDFGPSRYLAHADFAQGIVFLQDGTTSSSYAYRASGNYEGTTSGFVCAHNKYSLMAQTSVAYQCDAVAATAYSCGAVAQPFDHYIDDVFVEHVTEQQCTGYMYIRGLYMADGSPYYQYQELSRYDPSPNAVYSCASGPCAYEIREYSRQDDR